MILPGTNKQPGFHESDHTYPEVTIYQHGDDPVVLSAVPFGGYPLDGRNESDNNPSIISVSTHKDLGSASGSFSIMLKPSKSAETLFSKLVDDDWVDIVFYKHDSGYHVMRGLLDEVRRVRGVSGQGATSESFVLTGRDFGKIWESTPIWFSPFANDFVTQAYSTQIFKGVPEMYGSPGAAPLVFLKGFMEKITKSGGVNWTPPSSMPGILSKTFLGNVNFGESILDLTDPTSISGTSRHFQNKPMRTQYNPNGMNPNGMAWDLAREYSDPTFTEMYVDLLPNGDPFSPRLSLGDTMSPLDTQMTVVLRDKPFPVLTLYPGYLPKWNALPLHQLTRQEIVDDNTGRSGFERYNAFFVAPRLFQETLASHALYVIAPLLDNDSIKRHGLRRMDIQSNVVPDENTPSILGGPDISVLANWQRLLIRDWYCMNPYLLSGTITTGHGRPDIKIGNRLRIPGTLAPNPLDIEGDETYYIESVDQSWQAGPGMRTTIGVTRGWIGTYPSYLAELQRVAMRYKLPPMTVAVA